MRWRLFHSLPLKMLFTWFDIYIHIYISAVLNKHVNPRIKRVLPIVMFPSSCEMIYPRKSNLSRPGRLFVHAKTEVGLTFMRLGSSFYYDTYHILPSFLPYQKPNRAFLPDLYELSRRPPSEDIPWSDLPHIARSDVFFVGWCCAKSVASLVGCGKTETENGIGVVRLFPGINVLQHWAIWMIWSAYVYTTLCTYRITDLLISRTADR